MTVASQLLLFGDDVGNVRDSSRAFPTYPERPGFKARGTAEEAAQRIAGEASRLRAEVLQELSRWPAGRTADELAKLLKRSPLSVRPRLSELKVLGKIVATGDRRKNESGMTATVWKVTASLSMRGGSSWRG